jgi:diacylglycerol kinase
LVTGLGAICLGRYFRISAIEWLLLIAAIASVLCGEALNTALERTVDLIGPVRSARNALWDRAAGSDLW